MKNGLIALLVAVALGAGGLAYWQHLQAKEAAAEMEQLEAARDRAVQAAVWADSQTAILQAHVSALRDSVTWHDSVAAERIRVAHRAAETAEAELRATLTAEQERTLDELLEAHREEVEALQDRLDYYVDLVVDQGDLIESQGESVEHWRESYEAELAISDAWETRYKATQTVWNTPTFRWAERVLLLGFGIFLGTR